MSQPNRQPDPTETGPAEPAESRAAGPVAVSGARPGLYVVDTPADTPADTTTVVDTESSAEEPAERVVPLVPWDQRVLDTVQRVLQARPRWNAVPPSYAQTWTYSREGDWTTGEGGLLRAAHSALVLAAVAVLFPLDWVLNVVRGKPIGLVLVTAVVVLLAVA